MRGALVGVGLLFGLLCLACGGGPNLTGCEDFREAFNDLDCTTVETRGEELCPPHLDADGCDMTPYFECLRSNVSCYNDLLQVDIAACEALLSGCG